MHNYGTCGVWIAYAGCGGGGGEGAGFTGFPVSVFAIGSVIGVLQRF